MFSQPKDNFCGIIEYYSLFFLDFVFRFDFVLYFCIILILQVYALSCGVDNIIIIPALIYMVMFICLVEGFYFIYFYC